MAGLAWKWPRTRLPVGASALGVFVLCWLYVFPVYRLPDEKEIVQGVLLQQGKAWRRNQTAVALFRYRRTWPKGSGDGQPRESAARSLPGRPPHPAESPNFILSSPTLCFFPAGGRQAGPFLHSKTFFRVAPFAAGRRRGPARRMEAYPRRDTFPRGMRFPGIAAVARTMGSSRFPNISGAGSPCGC